MKDEEKWEEPLEDNGLTLGPEEILQREIEKSKSLKVDRLRLRDEIAQLKAQNKDLKEKNQQLQQRIKALNNDVSSSGTPRNSPILQISFWGPFLFVILVLLGLLSFLRN
tara:strand:+ start:215 stop:544 length:330 start_codon:yes stop_codon:yes gene_type:complete